MGWLDIMGLISKVPENAALKVQLEAEYRKSEELQEKVNRQFEETTRWNTEIRALEKENAALRTELAEYDYKAILVDIGPCLIKIKKDGTRLSGCYCHKCHEPLNKGMYGAYDPQCEYYCRRCSTYIPAQQIDDAISASKVGNS